MHTFIVNTIHSSIGLFTFAKIVEWITIYNYGEDFPGSGKNLLGILLVSIVAAILVALFTKRKDVSKKEARPGHPPQ